MINEIGKKIVSFCTHISPKFGSRVLYFLKFHRKIHLNNPIEFNEKLMWLKLNNYNNNETVWKCVDKYEMRKFCKDKGINEKYLTKLIGVYDNVDDINFDKLPEKFAIKCTHGMGYNIICDDKSNFNAKAAKKKLKKWLNTKFGYESAEIHYNHIKPKIICEEFIENEKGEFPLDYKIYCFNGKPKLILVCSDRKHKYKYSFYDINWKKIHLRNNETDKNITEPKSLEKMLDIAKILSHDFPFVRIDFYEHKGNPIIGELTFTPAACVGEYLDDASIKLGKMIKI